MTLSTNSFDLRAAADWLRTHGGELAGSIYGIEPGSRVPCPIHGGTKDNFVVHDDGRWSCYSRCGHGDLVTWVAVREHDHPIEQPVRGPLFRRVVAQLLDRAGKPVDDFPREWGPDAPDRKNAKPYPAREEVDALLAEAVLPIFALDPGESDRPLSLSGRARPGLPSSAQVSGLDLDGPGLVRILPARSRADREAGPEWCRTWRGPGILAPTYDGRGRLVSVDYRPDKVGKLKSQAPTDRSAGPLFLNRPARELLARDTSVAGVRAAEDATDRGVVITEGLPAQLAWARHGGPVMGLRGGNSFPREALLAIPREAPVYLDLDPDEAGAKYLRGALLALRSHPNVQWSARMAWYAERYPVVRAEVYAQRAPKRKEERAAADREIAERLSAERAQLARTNPRLLDPDDADGGPTLESWGFTPLPERVREEAGGRADDGTWRDRLRWDDKGLAKSTGNAILILQNDERWRGVLAYDERADELQIMREPPVPEMRSKSYPRALRDADETWIGAWLETEYGIEVGAAKLHAALVALAEQSSFDRVREYLEGAGPRWDGAARIDGWLVRYLGAEDTPLNRAIGAKWLISAVARALDPGCKVDHVLVLEGDQGAGKSTALASLCAEESWFTDQVPDLRDQKAAAEVLQGPWIVELAELAALGRAEVERTKAWVTTQRDRYRSPWGRTAQSHPRRCVFAATTNGSGYLKDPTGARRWWPVKVGRIDVEGLRAARGQLWAEAVVRYRKGERWYLDTTELAQAAAEAAEERYEGDAWEELLVPFARKRLIRAAGTEPFITMGELLREVGLEPAKQTRAHEMRAAAIMTSLGWQRTRRGPRSCREYGYVPTTRAIEAASGGEVGTRTQVGAQVGAHFTPENQGSGPTPNLPPTFSQKDDPADERQIGFSTDRSGVEKRSGIGSRLGVRDTTHKNGGESVSQPPRVPTSSGFDDFDDDEPEADPLLIEQQQLTDRWADGVGPRPRWPVEWRRRWLELYTARRTGPSGVADMNAGRSARETVDAEIAARKTAS